MMNKKLIWRISFVAIVGILIGLGFKSIEMNKVIKDLDAQILESENKLASQKEELKSLEEERDHMDSLEYIEKVAREKLGMVKKDDIVFKEK